MAGFLWYPRIVAIFSLNLRKCYYYYDYVASRGFVHSLFDISSNRIVVPSIRAFVHTFFCRFDFVRGDGVASSLTRLLNARLRCAAAQIVQNL